MVLKADAWGYRLWTCLKWPHYFPGLLVRVSERDSLHELSRRKFHEKN